jgi:TetR/AcrR family transcriptional repressor of nem operon
MPRTREFSTDDVLERAIATFRRHGFLGASLDVLTEGMGIGRGSLYGAFGDKRGLFLAALGRYAQDTVGPVVALLDDPDADPTAAIRDVLRMVARRGADPEGRFGCLITNTLAELGESDRDVAAITDDALATIGAAYERAVRRGQRAGTITPTPSVRHLARYLLMTMQGLRIMGRAGTTEAELLGMADTAALALRPHRRGTR